MNKNEHVEFAKSFSALGHKSRVAIFFDLLACAKSGCLFNEIEKLSGIPASTLSHHLGELERGGLIERIPKGRSTLFRPRLQYLEKVLGRMMAQCCAEERKDQP